MINSMVIRFIVILGMGFVFLVQSGKAQADLKQIKLYKEAFPGSKPKCLDCHVDEKPKKDDGAHEANDYGKAVVAADKEPTAETYTKVGKIEDFKKQ